MIFLKQKRKNKKKTTFSIKINKINKYKLKI